MTEPWALTATDALSRMRARLRQQATAPELPAERIQLLVTAVDPNLGFTGSSYRAANWRHWMTVQARPYLYRNRQYTSPRQLRNIYQTANLETLREQHPGTFQASRMRLEESLIFCCAVEQATPVIPPDQRPRLRR